jgi:predicted aspartyl protease/tetratricopeptide (TPR) repeat protein
MEPKASRARGAAAGIVAFVALSFSQTAVAAESCQLAQLAELPVTMVGTRPTVPGKINGQDVSFLVDTGAFYSMLSPAVSARLGLQTHMISGLYVEGIGGSTDARSAVVDRFGLGDMSFKSAEFLVLNGAGPGVAGLIGQNITNKVDVEFDLANGVMRFMRAQNCPTGASMDYWAPGKASVASMLPAANEKDKRITAYASVNGKRVQVLFDTGASLSGLTLGAAARAGVKPDSPGVVQTPGSVGIGSRMVRTWLGTFDSFSIGGEEVRNTRMRFSEAAIGDSDMLLGADFFLSHRIYFSQAQRKIYFTYNGGPVFRLDETAAQRATQIAATPSNAGAVPGAPTGEPTDAAGYARRAAAFLGRRDAPHAIEDLTHAIALAPDDPDNYFRRADARIQNRQPVLALADLDEGLKRRPDDTPSLLRRAALYIAAGDRDRGKADLDAASKLKAPDPSVRLNIANLYRNADFLDAALAAYTAWILDNPKDGQMAEALNGRCWTRAAQRRDLDLGLKDCDAAVRMKPGSPDMLDGRGLTHLARGEIDQAIADYDAALKIQPRAPFILYSRGVAKARKGLTAEGKADADAAIAMNARITDAAKRFGLVFDAAPAPLP